MTSDNNIITVCESSLLAAELEPTRDDVLLALNNCKRLKELATEYGKRAEELLTKYVEQNGEFTDGGVRYYVAVEKKYKCNDVREMVETALVRTGGDVDAMCLLLSSNAFKHGACKKLLGEDFQKFWTVSEAVDLKTGAPKGKRLQIVDTQFIKTGAAGTTFTEQGDVSESD